MCMCCATPSVDWSDAQCNGLRIAVGKELTDKV